MDENTTSANVSEAAGTDTGDAWDAVDLSDVDLSEWGGQPSETAEPETAADADQSAGAETGADAAEGTAESEKPAEAETSDEAEKDTFTLKVLGETRTVNRDEMIALAQKGADYDRIRNKLDGLAKFAEDPAKYEAYEAFLQELAQEQGISPEAVMDNARAALLVKKEGIDNSLALERVHLANERRQLEAEKQRTQQQRIESAAQQQAQEKRDAEIREFLAVYQDVRPETIPKEVWTDVQKGMSLLNAYTKYDNRKQAEALAAQRQNEKNHKRTTGSLSSAGAGKTQSEIERLWYDDE